MRIVFLTIVSLALCACSSEEAAEPAHPAADMVIMNGNVVTVDATAPSAEAIAIDGDRITAVGRDEEIGRSSQRPPGHHG